MRKTMLIFGAISGLVIIVSMIVAMNLGQGDGSMQHSELIGYLIMIVALSVIFIGIKRHRDRELGGVIRFGQAFLLGLGISLVAGLVYVVVWEIYLAATDHAFIAQWTEATIEAKKAEGVSAEELDAFVASMETMKERYANPLFRLPMTFIEIFPVGLLISLISAAILRNSKVLPAAA